MAQATLLASGLTILGSHCPYDDREERREKGVRVTLRLSARHLWFGERLEREFHRRYAAQVLRAAFILLPAADSAADAPLVMRAVRQ